MRADFYCEEQSRISFPYTLNQASALQDSNAIPPLISAFLVIHTLLA